MLSINPPFLVRSACSLAQLYVNSNSIGAKFIWVNDTNLWHSGQSHVFGMRETCVGAIHEKLMKSSGKVELSDPYEAASIVTLVTSFPCFLKLIDDLKICKKHTPIAKVLEGLC